MSGVANCACVLVTFYLALSGGVFVFFFLERALNCIINDSIWKNDERSNWIHVNEVKMQLVT